jgi:hypothetical protein
MKEAAMAPEFVIPYTALVSIGLELAEISDNLAAGNGAAFDVGGLDDPAQSPIVGAIDDFRDEWQASVRRLGENIGTLGDISQQIGTTFQQFDDQIATALRPAGPQA